MTIVHQTRLVDGSLSPSLSLSISPSLQTHKRTKPQPARDSPNKTLPTQPHPLILAQFARFRPRFEFVGEMTDLFFCCVGRGRGWRRGGGGGAPCRWWLEGIGDEVV